MPWPRNSRNMRGHIRNDAGDITVNIRTAFKIIGIGYKNNFLAGYPFFKYIRAGADGPAFKRAFGYIMPGQKMPGQNGCTPTNQRRGKRLVISYPESVIIKDFRLFYFQKIPE